MRVLRLAFPPLIVWMLSGGLFWILQSQSDAQKAETDVVAAFAPKPGTTEPQETAFVLPKARVYGAQLYRAAERPLFSETRRAPNPKPILEPGKIADSNPILEEESLMEQPRATPEPPALVFKGFVRNGDEMQALLGLVERFEEQWVSKGDVFLEWRVQEISATSVRLERDGFEYIVEISR